MKIKKIWLSAAMILCAASIAVMLIALTGGNNQKNEFVPPSFDSTAVQGTPDVPKHLGYSPIEAADAFTAHLCGNVTAIGKSAEVYFTNADTNTVWLKLRVLDSGGEIIGETGLIRPGEYVKTIILTKIPANDSAIKLKIMAYEPETYYSAGAVSLNTVMKIGG